MSLKHVILVVLKQGNSTGYEINQTFEGPLGIYWNTSHQAVYRALASMSKDAWVSYKEKSQEGKPDKKIYRITDKGEEVLDRWLAENQKPSPINESLLVKFFAGELCPAEALIEQVSELKNTHKKNMLYYESLVSEVVANIDQQSTSVRRGYLTVRRGILMEQSRLAWCEEALEMLNEDLMRSQPELL